MICEQCHKEFTPAPRHYHQRFCSRDCAAKFRADLPKRELISQLTFEREWAQWKKDFLAEKKRQQLKQRAFNSKYDCWKKDFAEGKTVSNL